MLTPSSEHLSRRSLEAIRDQCRAAGLTDRQMEVVLFHVAGYSQEQIGEQLGISQPAVHGHLARARRVLSLRDAPSAYARTLWELIQGYCYTEDDDGMVYGHPAAIAALSGCSASPPARPCETCQGSGREGLCVCPECDGSGYREAVRVAAERPRRVRVPMFSVADVQEILNAMRGDP